MAMRSPTDMYSTGWVMAPPIDPRRGACPRSFSGWPPGGLVRPVDLLEDLLPRGHASLSRGGLLEQHPHAPLAELAEASSEGRVTRQRRVHVGDGDDGG